MDAVGGAGGNAVFNAYQSQSQSQGQSQGQGRTVPDRNPFFAAAEDALSRFHEPLEACAARTLVSKKRLHGSAGIESSSSSSHSRDSGRILRCQWFLNTNGRRQCLHCSKLAPFRPTVAPNREEQCPLCTPAGSRIASGLPVPHRTPR